MNAYLAYKMACDSHPMVKAVCYSSLISKVPIRRPQNFPPRQNKPYIFRANASGTVESSVVLDEKSLELGEIMAVFWYPFGVEGLVGLCGNPKAVNRWRETSSASSDCATARPTIAVEYSHYFSLIQLFSLRKLL